MFAQLRHSLQTKFIAGIAIVVPIGVTVALFVMTFRWLDELFAPLAFQLTDHRIPGLGIASTLLIIFGVGLLVTNMVGRAFVSFGEAIVAKIPFIRNIYAGVKQSLEILTIEERKPFTQVALVEYPKKQNYTIGFVTTPATGEIQGKFSEPMVNIFIPTLPNPTTGFLLLVPQSDITVLPMTVEDGLKVVISGGIIYPPEPKEVPVHVPQTA